MKLNELVGARPVLEKIAGKEMDAKTAMAFAKFTKDVLIAIQDFETKRAGYFEKYGEAQEDNNIKIKPENEKKFKAAIKKSLNVDVKITPFDLSKSGVSVAPADLINALPLFK